MADRVEDVLVAAAVRRERLVGVDVGGGRLVGAVVANRALDVASAKGAHPQPPAIAGSSRTSSRSPTGVLSPSR